MIDLDFILYLTGFGLGNFVLNCFATFGADWELSCILSVEFGSMEFIKSVRTVCRIRLNLEPWL